MARIEKFSPEQYLLEDQPRTLFPLTTTKLVVANALPEIKDYISKILDPKNSEAFLVQQRCYASKSAVGLLGTSRRP